MRNDHSSTQAIVQKSVIANETTRHTHQRDEHPGQGWPTHPASVLAHRGVEGHRIGDSLYPQQVVDHGAPRRGVNGPAGAADQHSHIGVPHLHRTGAEQESEAEAGGHVRPLTDNEQALAVYPIGQQPTTSPAGTSVPN